MKNILLIITSLCLCGHVFAQDEWQRKWGIEATIAGGSFTENKTLVNEDQYNSYAVTLDYYIHPHLSVSGGLYLEQDGIMTQYADGIGMKSVFILGPEIGGKYYFLPKKWVIQPYLGAMLKTNILNLTTHDGGFVYEGDSEDCNLANVSYDVKCPALTFAPRLGIDLRLTKNIILTGSMDYRIGLYGHNRSSAQILRGNHAGNTYYVDESMIRNGFSLGVKVDLPWNSTSNSKISRGLIDLLCIWISSKR